MNNYKVSICVPIYGVEKYIKRCAESLLKQTYANIEYVFVNDDTKDLSMSLLLDVVNDYIERKSDIKIINHVHNRGLAAARNSAVSAATGDFILHVDSDDYLEETAVELLVCKQLENDADIVSANAVAHYPKYREFISHPYFRSSKQMALDILCGNDKTYIWGRLIRRSLYIDNNICVKEGLNMGEDLQVSAILAYYAKNVSNLSTYVYHYECCNVEAYTKSYSKDKDEQNYKSFLLLCNFFQNKGDAYVEAINISKIRRIAGRLITISRLGEKNAYDGWLVRKRTVPRKYWKYVPLSKRVVLYFDEMRFVRFYSSLMGGIKHFIQQKFS